MLFKKPLTVIITLLVIIFISLVSVASIKIEDEEDIMENFQVVFRSGFEPDTCLLPEFNNRQNIVGTDKSVSPPNDWSTADIFGSSMIQYQGGTSEDRAVDIIDDPTRENNKVLHYWVKNAVVPRSYSDDNKARIQMNIYRPEVDLQEFSYKFNWYIHPDIQKLESYPDSFSWLTFAEIWNHPDWINSDYPFRITFNIRKDNGSGKPLYFSVHGQERLNRWSNIWTKSNKDLNIPYGKWMTVKIYYKEGDSDEGQIYMSIKPEDEEKQVVFSVSDVTHHPDNPYPDGVWLNPLKMYCSQKPVNHIRNNNGIMQWYYDDFEFYVIKEN